MRVRWHHRLAVGLLAVAAGVGCNPLLAPFYLLARNDKHPAEYSLWDNRPKGADEITVAVLVTPGPRIAPELAGMDRLLAQEVVTQLQTRTRTNKEKVKVIPVSQLEKFKRDHPKWRIEHPRDVGEQLDADFVINVEIMEAGLYEPGNRQLLQARAMLNVSAFAVAKPEEDSQVFQYDYEYAPTHSSFPEMADMKSLTVFRREFLSRVASELCWKFTPHPTDESSSFK